MDVLKINGRTVGPGHPVYIVAELSANHRQDFDAAVALVRAAKAAGADAVKLQTYTPETITLDSDRPLFRVGKGLWEGRTLYDLYGEAMTPWEWHPRLQQAAHEESLDFFSTPFDETAVAFLAGLDVPAYKVASFELVDLPLIRLVAAHGRPVIISTGMGSLAEIDDAVSTARDAGAGGVAVLKCTSAYPAPPSDMNLGTIADMRTRFQCPVGLSDHTMGSAAAVAAVALGACIIEKHFVLSRAVPSTDSAFSMEPDEFRAMVADIRMVEQAIGQVSYGATPAEVPSTTYRRSLFVVEGVRAGDLFTARNVRSIRPAHGLPPKVLPDVLGRRAARDIERGTPLSWDLIASDGRRHS